MEYKLNKTNFSDDAVIAFSQHDMCKFGAFKRSLEFALQDKLADALVEYLESQGIKGTHIYDPSVKTRLRTINYSWFSNGKDCEILSIGTGGWQKGKLRIKFTLEFSPDEPEIKQITQSDKPEKNQPESPLDDIRRMMNKDT